jgi:Na+/melibiose symporter-like transporter
VFLILLTIFAYFTMHEIGFQPRTTSLKALPREMKVVARASLEFGWRKRSVRLLIIVGFIQVGFLSWGFYAWQPYFLELIGKEAVWVAGVYAAMISLATMGGNALVEYFTRFCGRRTTLLLWAAGIGAGDGCCWVAAPSGWPVPFFSSPCSPWASSHRSNRPTSTR